MKEPGFDEEPTYHPRQEGWQKYLTLEDLCEMALEARKAMPNVTFTYNDMNWVNPNKRKQIIRKSVDSFPDNPSKAGYKANEIKKAMFGFVTDEEVSVIEEINRVINDTNREFENIQFEASGTKVKVDGINVRTFDADTKVDKEKGKGKKS